MAFEREILTLTSFILGSLFHNYKGSFSLVLFELVDANYKFLFVEVGRPGSVNDARIYQESNLKQALDSGALHLPQSTDSISYHFLGDDIFPLTLNLMKPYSRGDNISAVEKVFNYR